MKKTVEVWVTRGKGEWEEDFVDLSDGSFSRPIKEINSNGSFGWVCPELTKTVEDNSKVALELRVEEFKKLYGFTPRKNSCKLYSITTFVQEVK